MDGIKKLIIFLIIVVFVLPVLSIKAQESQNLNAPALFQERPLYRVRIGPITKGEEASGILQDLIARGLKGAQIITE